MSMLLRPEGPMSEEIFVHFFNDLIRIGMQTCFQPRLTEVFRQLGAFGDRRWRQQWAIGSIRRRVDSAGCGIRLLCWDSVFRLDPLSISHRVAQSRSRKHRRHVQNLLRWASVGRQVLFLCVCQVNYHLTIALATMTKNFYFERPRCPKSATQVIVDQRDMLGLRASFMRVW